MKTNLKTKIQNNAPKIWGIVNITPDSFSDGGLFLHAEHALNQAYNLIEGGADIVDIGAASSRPSSGFITAEEEWARLEPFFALLEEDNDKILESLSLDTWRADVARKALAKGVPIINDISAFSWDNNLLDVLLEYKPYYVLMHCQGTPDTMQNEPSYVNVVDEVCAFFEEKLSILEKNGFPKEKIILDPGIGFGKSQEHNIALLNSAQRLLKFNLPLMAAVSRKSVIRHIFEVKAEDKISLDKATALISSCLQGKGFTHHRVHNVEETVQCLEMQQKLLKYIK